MFRKEQVKDKGINSILNLLVNQKLSSSGVMLEKLEKNEVDIAITVTDGFIAGKASGKPIEIAGTFVSSPLIWAVACNIQNTIQSLDELQKWQLLNNKIRIGISRFGI